MVSCPNIKRECLNHCWHSVPHDRVSMCTKGVCPLTRKKLVCSEQPLKINIHAHLRVEGAIR
jgi:hypothetical protein